MRVEMLALSVRVCLERTGHIGSLEPPVLYLDDIRSEIELFKSRLAKLRPLSDRCRYLTDFLRLQPRRIQLGTGRSQNRRCLGRSLRERRVHLLEGGIPKVERKGTC